MPAIDFDEELLESYPLPLAGTYARAVDQHESSARHAVLLALFEAYLKYVTVAALGLYLQEGGDPQALSRAVAPLRRPSLGHWTGLLRGIMGWWRRQPQAEQRFVFPELAGIYNRPGEELVAGAALVRRVEGVGASKVSLRQLFDTLVEYRNHQAHGAGASEEFYAAAIEPLQAALEELLKIAPSLAARELQYVDEIAPTDGPTVLKLMGERPRLRPQRRKEPLPGDQPQAGRLYLAREDGALLPLHPLMVFIRECGECGEPQVGILNGATQRSTEYLCYACGHSNTLPDMAADVAALLDRFEVEMLPEGDRPAYSVPNNLPQQLSSFVGRSAELAALLALLTQAKPLVRLVTLIGPGGVGKSRLSLQVAGAIMEHFPDGAYFVALSPVSEPALVLSAIADVLGIHEEAGRPLLETLKEQLREKQMLLVLDNFEQVVGAAPLLGELLAGAPLLKALVSSRAPLRLRGEQEFIVPPLALPNPRKLPPLDELAQNDAVALFVQRAQAVDAHFALSAANAAAVAEITNRLDGLPLAIELAAARTRLLAPQAMVARLGKRLALLNSGGARDLPAKQQTLRSTIGWSYDLLNPGSKKLFARLGVFVGGWTLESAEAVCNADNSLEAEVLDEMEQLVDESLLRRDLGSTSEQRFGMYETIREYALERLAAGDEDATLRQVHADYFMKLAEQAAPQLTGASQDEWLARLDAEHDNIRAALTWAMEQREARTALCIGAALWRFWEMHGHLSEGRRWLEAALAQTEGISAEERANALQGAGALAADQGDYPGAQRSFEESLALRRELGDKQDIAQSLNSLGVLAHVQGDYVQAGDFFQQSLQLFTELQQRGPVAGVLANLGLVALDSGDLAQAARLYDESLVVSRELGDKRGVAWTLNSLGEIALAGEDYNRARSLQLESLALCRELGDSEGMALCLESLAHIAGKQNRPLLAARLFGAAENLRETIGVPVDPSHHAAYSEAVALCRIQVDEPTWTVAWGAGRLLPIEGVIAAAQG